jgi:hypothetical protein
VRRDDERLGLRVARNGDFDWDGGTASATALVEHVRNGLRRERAAAVHLDESGIEFARSVLVE